MLRIREVTFYWLAEEAYSFTPHIVTIHYGIRMGYSFILSTITIVQIVESTFTLWGLSTPPYCEPCPTLLRAQCLDDCVIIPHGFQSVVIWMRASGTYSSVVGLSVLAMVMPEIFTHRLLIITSSNTNPQMHFCVLGGV